MVRFSRLRTHTPPNNPVSIDDMTSVEGSGAEAVDAVPLADTTSSLGAGDSGSFENRKVTEYD